MMSHKPKSPIAYDLVPDQVELALVALHVFDHLREGARRRCVDIVIPVLPTAR
jgi:hypothetical protein